MTITRRRPSPMKKNNQEEFSINNKKQKLKGCGDQQSKITINRMQRSIIEKNDQEEIMITNKKVMIKRKQCSTTKDDD